MDKEEGRWMKNVDNGRMDGTKYPLCYLKASEAVKQLLEICRASCAADVDADVDADADGTKGASSTQPATMTANKPLSAATNRQKLKTVGIRVPHDTRR
ncbi:hypothetical protein ACLKA6_012249 [Drosophila palustris]